MFKIFPFYIVYNKPHSKCYEKKYINIENERKIINPSITTITKEEYGGQ